MDADIKRKQVNLEQLNALLEFLKEHQELAKGLTRGRRGKLHTLKLWNLCAKTLNAVKGGASKDGKGWSKYWCDWKYRVRRRALELRAAKDNLSPPDGITPLSEMEEVIVSIIGENVLNGVIIKSDPLGEEDMEEEQDMNNDNDASESKCYSTRSKTSKKRKRRHKSKEISDTDDQAGPSSPPEQKPRLNLSNGSFECSDVDESAAQFLRLEREKLNTSKQMLESAQLIASEMTRLTDVLTHIRDVIINNRINI